MGAVLASFLNPGTRQYYRGLNYDTNGTLDTWHEIIERKDVSKLRSMIHADAVFRSPFAFKPYPGQDALVFDLTQVIEGYSKTSPIIAKWSLMTGDTLS